MYTFVVFLTSLLVSFFTIRAILPGLKESKLTGTDVNKPHEPEVPEMGGLAIVLGFDSGVLLLIGFQTFLDIFRAVEPVPILMALLTTLVISVIGLLDDLIGVKQYIKAIVPLFAAVPLMMIKVGRTSLGVPFLPIKLDFGPIYPLILVPFGVTGAANAVNMLAGFNGLEVGMGLVAVGALGVIAYALGAATSQVILAAAFGALLATLYFNWYPARLLIGDIGTFSIGTIIASAVIIGNYEFAGLIVIVPYAVDFGIKAVNGFPTEGWWGKLEDGKLHCPDGGPKGLAQLIMKLTDGITEQGLVLSFLGIESVFGLLAILFYLY